MFKKRQLISLAVVAGATVLAALTAIASRGGSEPPYGSWAPAVSSVASISQLPSAVGISNSLRDAVTRSATATGGDPVEALSSLRVLRSNLGISQSSIYAYSPTGTALCVTLWPRQGSCPTKAESNLSGVEFILSPGGPGYSGLPDNTPPAIAGVVNDSVKSITIDSGGGAVQLPIINNAFFADINEPPLAAFTVTIRVAYADGSANALSLNQGAPLTLDAAALAHASNAPTATKP